MDICNCGGTPGLRALLNAPGPPGMGGPGGAAPGPGPPGGGPIGGFGAPSALLNVGSGIISRPYLCVFFFPVSLAIIALAWAGLRTIGPPPECKVPRSNSSHMTAPRSLGDSLRLFAAPAPKTSSCFIASRWRLFIISYLFPQLSLQSSSHGRNQEDALYPLYDVPIPQLCPWAVLPLLPQRTSNLAAFYS